MVLDDQFATPETQQFLSGEATSFAVERESTVVIIDDSRSSLALLKRLVGETQVRRCHIFDDPTKAAAVVASLNASLVLVDYHMPKMNGIEFIVWMRSVAALADVPVIMVTASDDRGVRHAALQAGATDFLHKPVDVAELKPRLHNLLKLRHAQIELRKRAETLATEVATATETIKKHERELIFRLARAVEFRDPETGAHIRRMASYCVLIGEALGLAAEECDILELAAPLHDIGKIALRDSILLKSGKLTPAERAEMQQHATHGRHILADSSAHVLQVAAEIAWCHHEHWDGNGYPRGIRGQDIPLVARIVAVADVFDALTTERPYKQAWPIDKARSFVVENAGTQFDPACVVAFLRRWNDIVDIYEKGTRSATAA
jgi:putative two-component system response regulator